jgi:uncharacterized protein
VQSSEQTNVAVKGRDMNSKPANKRILALLAVYAVKSPSYIALVVISVYRAVLSPLLFSLCGPRCRFEPSCSVYAAEAISRYGLDRGGLMAFKRLLKCQPFGGWGPDPVPAVQTPANIGGRKASSR